MRQEASRYARELLCLPLDMCQGALEKLEVEYERGLRLVDHIRTDPDAWHDLRQWTGGVFDIAINLDWRAAQTRGFHRSVMDPIWPILVRIWCLLEECWEEEDPCDELKRQIACWFEAMERIKKGAGDVKCECFDEWAEHGKYEKRSHRPYRWAKMPRPRTSSITTGIPVAVAAPKSSIMFVRQMAQQLVSKVPESVQASVRAVEESMKAAEILTDPSPLTAASSERAVRRNVAKLEALLAFSIGRVDKEKQGELALFQAQLASQLRTRAEVN